ncbi:MAG: sugar phosphate isomerase/epimerase [Acidobacteriota bacterium]|nr:sugar phosphate isomerase/epimerase [Acidobacteriota bacterium]
MSSERDRNASRRKFLQTTIGAAVIAGMTAKGLAQETSVRPLKVSIFSKHLHWLEWEAMAQMAAEIGFDGVDLTLRKGGHVEPERAEQDLPKVAEIIRKAGLELPMVTAGIVDSTTPQAEAMMRAMHGVGVKQYRWGNLRYVEGQPIPAQLEKLKRDVSKLAELNRKYDLCAMYHTHSGDEVGAAIWDLWLILKEQDAARVAVNYDLCHATIEGGVGGWARSAQLVAPITRGIAIKDFRWERIAKGDWRPQKCPLGEGMVNFKRYFAILKEVKFSGPVQMHFEYPLGGAESGAKTLTIDKAKVIAAMRKDLATLRGWLRDAQLA